MGRGGGTKLGVEMELKYLNPMDPTLVSISQCFSHPFLLY